MDKEKQRNSRVQFIAPKNNPVMSVGHTCQTTTRLNIDRIVGRLYQADKIDPSPQPVLNLLHARIASFMSHTAQPTRYSRYPDLFYSVRTQIRSPEGRGGNRRVAFTMAGGRSPLLRADNGRLVAFTMSEVLITIGIIGVVAAMTLPGLMHDVSERVNTEKQVNTVWKVTQAMDKMRSLDRLGKFTTTDEFADEFQKHIKIVKRCDSNHLKDCWPTSKVTTADNTVINIADVKTGKDLGFKNRENINNVGFVLADGSSLIVTYNPEASAKLSYETPTAIKSPALPVGRGKTRVYDAYTTDSTSGIAYIMDVNGGGVPNEELQDIRGFNNAHLSQKGKCVGVGGVMLGTSCVKQLESYEPVNCSPVAATDSENAKWCGTPSGYTNDYWAGAKKACDDIGMTLPDSTTLKNIYNAKELNESINVLSGRFESSSEASEIYAHFVDFSNGYGNLNNFKYNQSGVLCVGN